MHAIITTNQNCAKTDARTGYSYKKIFLPRRRRRRRRRRKRRRRRRMRRRMRRRRGKRRILVVGS